MGEIVLRRYGHVQWKLMSALIGSDKLIVGVSRTRVKPKRTWIEVIKRYGG